MTSSPDDFANDLRGGQPVGGEGVHLEGYSLAQAAQLLNVSEQYVNQLIDEAKIECAAAAVRRRVTATSLGEYMKSDDLSRASAGQELTRLLQEMNLT
jgi:excisionase family DNA binding protein